VSRARAKTLFHTSNLLLANNTVRNLVHRLERLPITDLLVEELVEIQTHHLSFLTDTQVHARNVLESQQQNARHDERVSRDGGDFGKLLADLHAVAVDPAGGQGGAVEGADLLVGEDSCEEGAHHAADAVELEDVEAFVDVQPLVEVLEGSAGDGGDEADDSGKPDGHVASSGCDADQTSDGTLTGTDDGEASLGADVIDEHPADSTGRGGNVSVKCSVPDRFISYW
jgi:hypothetical protein